jgi:hypothetical protein
MCPSAWLLPEHIADVLPAQARRIEELRRGLLDRARGYGFELVMPPLLEHLESLLSGTGRDLDLKTFKLVDQLSGRTLGVRADTTPQVARIDAHLLNRAGVTRLCYCGPVLHTRPPGWRRRASRCSSAPRSSATPAWRPTWRCRPGAGLPAAAPACRSLSSTWPTRASLRGVLAGVPMAGKLRTWRTRWPRRTPRRWPP